MSQESFEQFRQLVLREPSLQVKLRETMDLGNFVDLVLQAGKDQGFDFTKAEVQEALQASRRAWLERWI
jgi:hypothetical protein